MINTTDPTVPSINETGTSKGIIIVRDIISQRVIVPIPNRHTHGRLLLRSSPRYIDTILGTIKPKKGKFPITAATIPTAKEISPVPRRTILL
jgi:hypothetical protein